MKEVEFNYNKELGYNYSYEDVYVNGYLMGFKYYISNDKRKSEWVIKYKKI